MLADYFFKHVTIEVGRSDTTYIMGYPKFIIGCRQHTFSEQYSGGGVKSGYTSHKKPALFVSGITMGGFWNIPGRIVKEGEEALRTAKR